jgi:hypothetical protein
MAEIVKLTSQELVELQRCEQIIQDGLQTTGEVIMALKTIKDGKLYRQDYRSFEAYCSTKWGFGANYAGKLIVARELKALSDEEKVQVWEKAAEAAGSEDKITAKLLHEATREHRRQKNKYEGPDPEPIEELARLLISARKRLESLLHEECGAWLTAETVTDLESVVRAVRAAKPKDMCSCRGAGCEKCAGIGWLSAGRVQQLALLKGNENAIQ